MGPGWSSHAFTPAFCEPLVFDGDLCGKIYSSEDVVFTQLMARYADRVLPHDTTI